MNFKNVGDSVPLKSTPSQPNFSLGTKGTMTNVGDTVALSTSMTNVPMPMGMKGTMQNVGDTVKLDSGPTSQMGAQSAKQKQD